MNLNLNIKKQINPVQLISFLLAFTMLLIFKCDDKFFNIWNYYLFPIVIIMIGCISILCNIIKNKKVADFNIAEYCMIFITFYVVFSSVILRRPAKFDSVISYGFLFLFLLVCSTTKFNKEQVMFILKSYIASAVILTIIIIIQRKTPYPGVLRYSIFFSKTEYYDVNFLAAYIAIPALLAYNNAILRTDKKGKKIFYGITAFLVLGIFLTGSRGALVGFAIGVIYILYANKKITIKSFKKPKLKTVILIMLSIVVVYLLLPKELVNRFFLESYNDGSNQKRIHHWIYGMQSAMKYPIFGDGVTFTSDIINNNFGINYTAHNTFIGIFMQLGIVGTIPFMLILLEPIKKLYKSDQKGLIGVILGLLFILIMIEIQTSLLLFIHLAIIYIILRYSADSKTNIIL